MISYDIYLFHYYSLDALLNRLDDLHVGVKKYYVHEKYKFYLKINRKYRKIISDNLKDFNIVDKIGIVNFFEKLIFKPITLVSLLVSVCLFINLSTRIYKIDIKGDFPSIEGEILEFLKLNNVYSFSYVNDEKIKEIEGKLKEEFNDELEFVEVVKEGATVSLNYKKRRKALVIEGKKGSLYASKDGVIRGFSILSGVKNVKLYEFVKKGDLLVSDILITPESFSKSRVSLEDSIKEVFIITTFIP